MELTANGILAKVRRVVGDEFAPYRWEDGEMRGHIQTALMRLGERAPHTRYVNGEALDYVELPEDGDAAIPVHPRYEEALAYYVAHLCYCKDNPDTANAELVGTYFAKAERLMV